jgi:hypothetical protein
VLAPLGVGEVGPVVLVDCETEAAFEGADVVLEEVWVFVEVYGFEGELAESFAAVGVRGGLGCYSSAAEFRTCAILWGIFSIRVCRYGGMVRLTW